MDNKEKIQTMSVGLNLLAIEVKGDNICFNLTEMAKLYGTDPAQWLKYNESKNYIKCVALLRKVRTADLLTVRRGGVPHEQGTWANDYRIAIEFARWLDPMLSIQINELVWKLLTKQAVVAEPIGDVWPIIRNGRVGYPRKEILEAAGYSSGSGTIQRLKKRYPDHHFTISRIACVSAEFAKLRMEQSRVRQMELQFQGLAAIAKA
ncbi:MAG: KilA-N domain-containing protein [Tannerellaceae bacterium]|jgi:hypothetical protein|nr:KilA-N domain-containing protein [Tannerellaceae bacterium]